MGNRSVNCEVRKIHPKARSHTYSSEDLGYDADNDSPIMNRRKSTYHFNPNSSSHMSRFNRHFVSIKCN